jgi:hypothetical protein
MVTWRGRADGKTRAARGHERSSSGHIRAERLILLSLATARGIG